MSQHSISEQVAPWPVGFFKSEAASGKEAGLGFFCPACHLLILDHAPESIKHCRREDSAPGAVKRAFLSTYRIPGGQVATSPSFVVPV